MEGNLNNIVEILTLKEYKNKKIIKHLKENKELLCQKDNEGNTLIHLLIKKIIDTIKMNKNKTYDNKKYRLLELIITLINNGIDINSQNIKGETILIMLLKYTIFFVDSEYIRLLIIYGANIDIQDNDGRTALLYACININNHTFMKEIIEKGANVDHKDNDGKTALMYLCNGNTNKEIIEKLIKKGANINYQNKDGKNSFDDCLY